MPGQTTHTRRALDGLKPSKTSEAGQPRTGDQILGIVIGTLVREGGLAEALVDYPGNPIGGPVAATSTVCTEAEDVGREVAIAFQAGAAERPVILGFIHHPAAVEELGDTVRPAEQEDPARSEPDPALERAIQVSLDGERLELCAAREIVLRCGKSSITLTRAGKVLIRGRYLLSRSSGVNRIKGGSVQIN